MEWSGITAFATCATAIAALIAAYLSLKTARQVHETGKIKVLLDLRNDYRSDEMMIAVACLWNFYNNNKEKEIKREDIANLKLPSEIKEKIFREWDSLSSLKRAYIIKYEEYTSKLKEKKDIKNTLHYQRRLVKMFYEQLALLYINKEIPVKYIDDYLFKIETLEIIEDILYPTDEVLSLCGVGEKHVDKTKYLPLKLYYAIKKKKKMIPK